jgi:hypothetical protein
MPLHLCIHFWFRREVIYNLSVQKRNRARSQWLHRAILPSHFLPVTSTHHTSVSGFRTQYSWFISTTILGPSHYPSWGSFYLLGWEIPFFAASICRCSLLQFLSLWLWCFKIWKQAKRVIRLCPFMYVQCRAATRGCMHLSRPKLRPEPLFLGKFECKYRVHPRLVTVCICLIGTRQRKYKGKMVSAAHPCLTASRGAWGAYMRLSLLRY